MTRNPTPPPLDQASPEDRILAAATEEFAANGFYGARTQAIADAAGLNKAMLHYYFRTKENLYGQVIKAAMKKILTQVGEAWLGKAPLKRRLIMVVDSYMDNYEQNPGFIKIILREVVDGGDRFRQIFRELRDEDLEAMGLGPAELVGRVSDELDLSPHEVIHLVLNIVGMCVISFTSPLLLEGLLDLDLSDFEGYLKQRRIAIKAMALAYLELIMGESTKE
ncbi:MAG: TetR/AcrR family transcriptional regulator [Proteobacteria bacterium]|nr:TetR/AcrR family transcriptional regulator [Pseudomonadota bacterium]